MPTEQVEVQAEVLTEAFTVNLESLVTKEFLTARFAEQNFRIDTRFAELEAKIDSNQRINFWFQGIILAAIVIPYLERMLML